MMNKEVHKQISYKFLKTRINPNYPKQKWITFCETLLSKGYSLFLYEAKETVSKYITVKKNGKSCKVRFSNHRPAFSKEMNKDCDFFVGVTNFGWSTTEQVLKSVYRYVEGEQNDKQETKIRHQETL